MKKRTIVRLRKAGNWYLCQSGHSAIAAGYGRHASAILLGPVLGKSFANKFADTTRLVPLHSNFRRFLSVVAGFGFQAVERPAAAEQQVEHGATDTHDCSEQECARVGAGG